MKNYSSWPKLEVTNGENLKMTTLKKICEEHGIAYGFSAPRPQQNEVAEEKKGSF